MSIARGGHGRGLLVALALLFVVGPAAAQTRDKPAPSAPNIDVRVVKYAALGETIKHLKGRVVVVDFWGLT